VDLLDQALQASAQRQPSKTALVEGSATLSYVELERRVGRLAGYLAARFPPGSRFGILLPNSIAAVVGLYGASAAGLIAVPMDSDIHPRRAERLVRDCQLGAVLTTEQHLDRVPLDIPFLILAGGTRPGRNRVALEPILADARNEPAHLPERSADDVVGILYTAGTTGRPKGVMLTHRNLAAAVRNIVDFMGLDEAVVESLPMRLSHSFGFARLRCVLHSGGTALLEPGFLRPERLLHRLWTHNGNALSSVPAGLAILLDHHLEAFKAVGPRLRYMEIGSARLSTLHRDVLLDICPNARIAMHYGLTESSRATLIDLRAERDRWGTAGRPAPGVEIRIVDERGAAAAPGERGEILIRGAANAIGYWGRGDATSAAFADGWLRTRDLGCLDTDGYLHLDGRLEEMINLGGIKVSPVEVEETLMRLDGVHEAAVVGLTAPAEVSGILIKAYLVLRDGAAAPSSEALKRACLGDLEAYKVPQEFEVVLTLPKNASGKVRKDLLASRPGGRGD
jgi:long-chain acyl-CoA synthetase